MSGAGFATADLCDAHGAAVHVLDLVLHDFGAQRAFAGEISTVRAFEDNSRVREAVHEAGHGRVLVVDGSGSLRRAMLGDLLAAKAVENGWSGIIINGAIRDSVAIAALDLGVKALGTCPRKTDRAGIGERDVVLQLGGILITPGEWIHADADGVLVSEVSV